MLFSPWLRGLKFPVQLTRPTRHRKRRSIALVATECLEDRTLLSTIVWDGDAGDFQWSTAENWIGNVSPVPGDDVVIDVFDNDITVT